MGLGQTMLTAMFLVLLSVAAMNANRLIIDRETSFYEQEAYKQAGILANSLLQEIARKKFDSRIDTADAGYVSDPTYYYFGGGFDPPASLGGPTAAYDYINPGGADDVAPYKSIPISPSTSRFDDVDDYKGYHRSASSGGLDGFILTVDVYYVKSDGTLSNVATYYKEVKVIVTNSKYLTYKNASLTFKTIIAY